MSATTPETKRWTRSKYHAAADAEAFQDERVELIRGKILTMSPMEARHAAAVRLSHGRLQTVTPAQYTISIRLPLAPGEQPEPDISVVRGAPRDFTTEHPVTADLVVEISHSTLPCDRTSKRQLYAEHEIADYWILNLKDRQLEIHRSAQDGDDTAVTVVDAQTSTTPLIAPIAAIAVADLLP